MNKKILLGTLFASLVTTSVASAAGEAKNVIFFLGDGLGPTVVTAARIYKYGEAGKLTLESFDRTARIKTFSNDAQTTDSAPSMSAYMTGVKMNNEVLSMTSSTLADKTKCVFDGSNGSKVKTLLELAKAKGLGVGAVTTTELTHATPAATYAHICHRDLAYDIAAQAVPGGAGFNADLLDGVDVLFGGGRNHWTPLDTTTNPKGRADGRNLVQELIAKGWSYAADKAAFTALSADSTRVVGLFSATSHLSYELDRDSTQQPSLSEMTGKAIATLQNVSKKSGKGYFLMVEGGRIDHALHSTNAKRALEDAIAFDNAVKEALSRVDLKDTLIVVTADHDHTMVINGYPKRGNAILDVVKGLDGNPMKDGEGFTYPTLAFGNGESRPDTRADVASADALANDYHQIAAFKKPAGSETHGGGDVMLMATGAGSTKFKGTLDNTKVFGLVKEAFGL